MVVVFMFVLLLIAPILCTHTYILLFQFYSFVLNKVRSFFPIIIRSKAVRVSVYVYVDVCVYFYLEINLNNFFSLVLLKLFGLLIQLCRW